MMEFVNEKRKQNNKELISDAAFLAELWTIGGADGSLIDMHG